MAGFKDIVDAVGGVDVNNDLDFQYENIHFEKVIFIWMVLKHYIIHE